MSKVPIAELKKCEDFKRLRGEGESIKKQYWFNQRMHQLIQEIYPDSIEEFRNFDQWFARFCRCFKVSLGQKTHTAQKTPAEVEIILCKFHKHLLIVYELGHHL